MAVLAPMPNANASMAIAENPGLLHSIRKANRQSRARVDIPVSDEEGDLRLAASLEAEWNAKPRALSEAEQNYERQRQANQLKISEAQRGQILALASNFPRLWNDPATANRERKRMVRLLIEDITIRKGEQI